MKKLTKIAVGACAASMALTMAGCAGTTEAPSDTSLESSAETSPDFNPEENIPVTVYGPPEMLDGSPAFDPESNQNEDVYGPPEMFEDSTDGQDSAE